MSTNLSVNESSRIGCHCWGTNPVSVDALPTFASVGCRWVRATRPMQMDVVATGPHRFNFADRGERSIDRALSLGMSVMGILDGRWGNETGFNDLPYASPIWEHLDQWEEFVTAAVNFYRDRVKFWEIINEPPFFWWYPTPEGQRMPEVNPLTKRAPIWAYADLLKASARAIRSVDPDARIVMGSGFSDGLFLKRLYELGCKDAFDIASVHYLNCKHPDDFGMGCRRLRSVMADFGDSHKPLWDTENGPGGAVIGHAVQTPGEYEGLYNIYRYCLAHEHGLERYFWFNPVTTKEPGIGHASSCRNADGSLTPAYRAMEFLVQQVGNGSLLTHEHPGKETHVYVFDGPHGPVSILWATAPAAVRLAGGRPDAADYLGNPVRLDGAFQLTGQPIYIEGDVAGQLDVSVEGPRETVVTPMKQADPATPRFRCPGVNDAPPGIHDPFWETVPYVVRSADVPITEQDDHFCLVTTSVSADLQLTYTQECLLIRARTYDPSLNPGRPAGLVQFTLRDQNPGVTEWSYFYNSYGLFNLYLSARGSMVLRYEHIYPDRYPSGLVEHAIIQVEAPGDGLLFWAAIPWEEIGPCRPGKYEPFLMMFSFNRCDNILDLPDTDTPEEWSHNFADNFIVKKPALTRMVVTG